jgi:hypothetical protein
MGVSESLDVKVIVASGAISWERIQGVNSASSRESLSHYRKRERERERERQKMNVIHSIISNLNASIQS